MSIAPDAELLKPESGDLKAILLLALATLLALVPFIDKPFHIDDPLFVWGAQHIRENFWSHPFDFYGFEVLWSARYEPMHEVTQNPPLALYFLAGASLLGGWNEISLHVACLLPAIGVVIGTWRLGIGMTMRPLLAALAVLCTPIFLVSSSNVMCDTLMVCFWVWSVVLWREGLQRNRWHQLLAAACLVGLATLTKYFAISLIPLLALFTLARERRPWLKLLWLLIPCGMLVAYHFWTKHLYGHSLLTSAARFARENYQAPARPGTMKPFGTLAFTGGSVLCLIFYSFRISRRPGMFLLSLSLVVILTGVLLYRQPLYLCPRGYRPTPWDLALQGSLLVVAGLGVIWLVLNDVWEAARAGSDPTVIDGLPPNEITEPPSRLVRQQLADSLLLAAWVAGTLVFAGAINWTINGRSVLPLVPSGAILLCRGLDRSLGPVTSPLWEGWPLIPAVAISLLVTHADYRWASAAPRVAEEVMSVARKNQVTLWFSGHWGFQYYMKKAGAQPVHSQVGRLEAGDFFLLPENNDVQILPPSESKFVDYRNYLISKWASTHQPDRCTGFYSDAWGSLPFAIGQEMQSDPKYEDAIKLNPYDVYRLGRLADWVNIRPLTSEEKERMKEEQMQKVQKALETE